MEKIGHISVCLILRSCQTTLASDCIILHFWWQCIKFLVHLPVDQQLMMTFRKKNILSIVLRILRYLNLVFICTSLMNNYDKTILCMYLPFMHLLLWSICSNMFSLFVYIEIYLNAFSNMCFKIFFYYLTHLFIFKQILKIMIPVKFNLNFVLWFIDHCVFSKKKFAKLQLKRIFFH